MIVRLHISGGYDFSKFDPLNNWCWKRLVWVIDELGNQEARKLTEARFFRSLAYLTSPHFSDSQYDELNERATKHYNALLVSYFPWNKEEIDTGISTQTAEGLVNRFREAYGYPGDPQYEEMVRQTQAVFDELARRKRAGITEIEL
jgi:hypothetical protein